MFTQHKSQFAFPVWEIVRKDYSKPDETRADRRLIKRVKADEGQRIRTREHFDAARQYAELIEADVVFVTREGLIALLQDVENDDWPRGTYPDMDAEDWLGCPTSEIVATAFFGED